MADIIYIKLSDSRSWLHCRRRVWYDNFPPEDFEVGEPDPFDALIMKMGINHEWDIKRDLEKKFQVIEAISNEHNRYIALRFQHNSILVGIISFVFRNIASINVFR